MSLLCYQGKEVKLAAACVGLVPEDPQDKIPVPLLEEGKGQICFACHPATDWGMMDLVWGLFRPKCGNYACQGGRWGVTEAAPGTVGSPQGSLYLAAPPWGWLILPWGHLEISQCPSQPLFSKSLKGICYKQGYKVSHLAVQSTKGLQEGAQDTFSQCQAAQWLRTGRTRGWWDWHRRHFHTLSPHCFNSCTACSASPAPSCCGAPLASLSLLGWGKPNSQQGSRDPHHVAPHCEKSWIFKDKNQMTTPLTLQKLLLWKQSMLDRTESLV